MLFLNNKVLFSVTWLSHIFHQQTWNYGMLTSESSAWANLTPFTILDTTGLVNAPQDYHRASLGGWLHLQILSVFPLHQCSMYVKLQQAYKVWCFFPLHLKINFISNGRKLRELIIHTFKENIVKFKLRSWYCTICVFLFIFECEDLSTKLV